MYIFPLVFTKRLRSLFDPLAISFTMCILWTSLVFRPSFIPSPFPEKSTSIGELFLEAAVKILVFFFFFSHRRLRRDFGAPGP